MTAYKDIRMGDFVRVAYNRQWPGQFEQNTADIIDWGFIVSVIEKEKMYEPSPPNKRSGEDTFILKSNDQFAIVIRCSRKFLENIIVEHYPKRTFEDVGHMRIGSDIVWKVKSDRDAVVLLVHNPREEQDEDGWIIEWDKVTKENGQELTDDERDKYYDDLRRSLRGLLHT